MTAGTRLPGASRGPRRPAPRDACPSLVAPMATGDGLIARLLPTDGTLAIAALVALCAAARDCGNGVIEVTQRGSLQVRGLRPETAARLEQAVQDAGISPPAGPPVHVGPLAGLDAAEIADPRPIAAMLRAPLAAPPIAATPIAATPIAALPAKLAIVVDGGGRWGLDNLAADIRLVAVATDAGVRWSPETDDGPIAPPLAPADAVAAVVARIEAIGRSERRRPRPRVPQAPVGVLWAAMTVGAPADEGAVLAAGIVVPYGFTDAERLAALAAAAQAAGAASVRLAPGHGLVFVGEEGGHGGRPPFDGPALLAAAGDLGFITRADDPRLALSVCAGAPACASGTVPTRPLADAVVAAAAPLIAAGGSVHLSGCAKGCARAAPATLTIVGEDGRYGLVRDGRAGDVPLETVPPEVLLAAIARVRRADRAGPAG